MKYLKLLTAVALFYVFFFNVVSWGLAHSFSSAELEGVVVDKYQDRGERVVLVDFGSTSAFWKVSPEQYRQWKLSHPVVAKPNYVTLIGITNASELPMPNELLKDFYWLLRWFNFLAIGVLGLYIIATFGGLTERRKPSYRSREIKYRP